MSRRICFVTGTRAEFGLLSSTLRAISAHPSLSLQIIATGMHLSKTHGHSLSQLRRDGWHIDATVPWRGGSTPSSTTIATGLATASLARAFDRLKSDVVLVVGDRVEAFAAASAAHISGRILAHVHGGDRALGQVDDALRHAISKLAHIHFAATASSAERLLRLGEDPFRVHAVGSPGIDSIRSAAAPRSEIQRQFNLRPRRFALLVLHPASADDKLEERRARLVLDALLASPIPHTVIVYPNNDPGSRGVLTVWDQLAKTRIHALTLRRDLPRPLFLGLLRDAALLLGNSSSGIIEAASFGTPVIDIGPRQFGREHGPNVLHVGYDPAEIGAELGRLWNAGHPLRFKPHNPYGSGHASRSIARLLSSQSLLTPKFRHKLISY